MRGCAVSRRYIDDCYCDVFSVVNVYLDHLKFCVVCINGRRYVCCGECYVVSDECDWPTSWGPTECACSMAVPVISTRPRTSALRMSSTYRR